MNTRRVINIRCAQIRNLDLSNGEGIGVALFVQGCHFHCKNCFNPETWNFSGGKEWTHETKEKFLELIDKPYIRRVSLLGGECLAEENLDDVQDLVTEINKRYNAPQYIDNDSENKYNISINNPDEIRLSLPQKSIWLYTGFTWDNIFDDTLKNMITQGVGGLSLAEECGQTIINNEKRRELVSRCNVLIDGRYIDSQRDITLPWCGSANQRVIDIKESLQKGEVVLWKT